MGGHRFQIGGPGTAGDGPAERSAKSGAKVCKKWTKGLQKVVRWFLDADDYVDSHRNLIITFWPIYNVPSNLHANLFRGIRIKSTN